MCTWFEDANDVVLILGFLVLRCSQKQCSQGSLSLGKCAVPAAPPWKGGLRTGSCTGSTTRGTPQFRAVFVFWNLQNWNCGRQIESRGSLPNGQVIPKLCNGLAKVIVTKAFGWEGTWGQVAGRERCPSWPIVFLSRSQVPNSPANQPIITVLVLRAPDVMRLCLLSHSHLRSVLKTSWILVYVPV